MRYLVKLLQVQEADSFVVYQLLHMIGTASDVLLGNHGNYTPTQSVGIS